ncbi:MAG: hypothetical protein WAQ48_08690 [Limnochordia bacterium]
MNRKLLLLTAVVLMAVMLSGCKLLGEVDVTIKDDDGVLEEVKLGTADEPLKEGKLEFKANRFSEVVLEFNYKPDIEDDDVEWKRREKKLDVSELADGDGYDYTLSFRTWLFSVEIEVKEIDKPTGE